MTKIKRRFLIFFIFSIKIAQISLHSALPVDIL